MNPANFLKARDIEAIALSTMHITSDTKVPGPPATRPMSRVDRILRSLATINPLRLVLVFQH
jgi:hypothetical protein